MNLRLFMDMLDRFFSDNPYILYEGRHWKVLLHQENQSYLGRSIVFLTSREIDDVLELTTEERDELWEDVMPRLARALKSAFGADRINYAHLANTVKHVHWHVVPRYEENPVRKFAGETFTDENVGRHYVPAPHKALPPDKLEAIASEINHYINT